MKKLWQKIRRAFAIHIVSGSVDERYPMCEEQSTQIDCRVTTCKFYKGAGKCSNVSPALTLNPDKTFVCWSRKEMAKYKNSNDMKDKIFDIVTELIRYDISKDEAIDKLWVLYNLRLSLFQKNRLDLLNWAKSELKQETNTKLGKTMNPYRSDKIIFLRRIVEWLNNEA